MLGQIVFDGEGFGKTEYTNFGRAAVLTICVPKGRSILSLYFARRAAKFFQKQKVRLAAFPIDYPYVEIFARQGIQPTDELVLRRACADKIVLCVLRQMGKSPKQAAISLISEKRSAEFDKMVCALAEKVRYITLCTSGGEQLSDYIRHLTGAALRLGEKSGRYDLTVLWDENGNMMPAENVLRLPDRMLTVDYRLAKQPSLSPEISPQFLAGLLQTDAVSAEQIEVLSVKRKGKGIFP